MNDKRWITSANWRSFDYKELSKISGQAMGDIDVGIWGEIQQRKERAEQVKALAANLTDENIRTLQVMVVDEVDSLIEREILIALRSWAHRHSVEKQVTTLLDSHEQDIQTSATILGKLHRSRLTPLIEALPDLKTKLHLSVAIHTLEQYKDKLTQEQLTQFYTYKAVLDAE